MEFLKLLGWPYRGRFHRQQASTITTLAFATLLIGIFIPTPAHAWGDEGHEVVAMIARAHLNPDTLAKVDAILASDPDTLTAPDMASRATWADKWRDSGHRETADWHFVDTELDAPDQTAACFGQPAPSTPASAGPAQDCVVDRAVAFSAELAAPDITLTERLLALKYLLHFVGDMHQPLHASDNHDRGGNCVLVSLHSGQTVKLHVYWDTTVIVELGSDPTALAATLDSQITPDQVAQWQTGSPADWAMEAYQVSRTTAYRVGSAPGCPSRPASISLPAGYDAAAQAAASLQLQRAGIRLAFILNTALSAPPSPVTPAPVDPGPVTSGPPSITAPPVASDLTPAQRSKACSAEADSLGLHGAKRRAFRRKCMANDPSHS